VPEHRNIGDQLIWRGEHDFLKQIPHNCLFTSSLGYHRNPKIAENTIILLHGGGNFGDVWLLHQKFREDIIQKYPNNRIILFPQSVQFENQNNLENAAEIFNNHGNITICARDLFSYELLSKYFTSCKILMVPDMAFSSTLDFKKVNKKNKKNLILKRIDKELATEINEKNYLDFEVKDWPTYNMDFFEYVKKKYTGLNRRSSELILNNDKESLDSFRTFGVLPYRKKDDFIKIGIDFLNSYEINITTRLHGHILSLLLGLPSIMIDNSYGKNKRFHSTWLSNVDNSYFADNMEDAIVIYNALKSKK
jgi:pyruvyl transferase EpsO